MFFNEFTLGNVPNLSKWPPLKWTARVASRGLPQYYAASGGAWGLVGRDIQGDPTGEFPTWLGEGFRAILESTISNTNNPVMLEMLYKIKQC